MEEKQGEGGGKVERKEYLRVREGMNCLGTLAIAQNEIR